MRILDIFDARGRRSLALVAFLAILTATFDLLGIGLFVEFMSTLQNLDQLASSPRTSSQVYRALGFSEPDKAVLALGGLVIMVLALGKLICGISSWAANRFVWTQETRLSTIYLEHYLRLPYERLLQIHGGEIARDVMASRLNWGVLRPIVLLLNGGSVTLLIGLGLLLVEPTLALISGATLIAAYALLQVLSSKIQGRLGQQATTSEVLKQKAFSECLQGLLPIVVGSHQDHFVTRFKRHTRSTASSVAQQTVTTDLPRFFLEAVALAGIVALSLLIALGSWGSEQLMPLLSLYAMAAFRVLPSFHNCYCALVAMRFHRDTLEQFQQVVARSATQNGTLGADPGRTPIPAPGELQSAPPGFEAAIQLKDVYYEYPGRGTPALDGIDLEIPRGCSLGIVGRSGSGKSTLVNILLGLLRPGRGEILFDETPMDTGALEAWRRTQVGYVPQETFLLDDTVRRNVAFGFEDEQIDEQAVERACRAAGIHEFVCERLEDGYETRLGERGIRLSGGQRQRFGIARALYHEPQILILDEATSSLDTRTESEIMQAVGLLKDTTLILVSHRLALTLDCDNICLLEDGRLAAQGSHAQLRQANPSFRELLNQ